jgi:translation initiation factor 4A
MTEKIDYQNSEYDDFSDIFHDSKYESLLKGIYEYGFEKPSSIQSKAIKPIIDGRDLIAQAQSGSGKTGAFVLGALSKINIKLSYPQGVIVANTRELAVQIKDVACELGKYTGIKIALCKGGMQNETDGNIMDHHLLICTPGKLIGTLKKNPNLFNNLAIFILDEADQLLSANFIDQTQAIMTQLHPNTQVCIFSATTNSKNIQNTKEYFLKNQVEIYIKKEEIQVNKIKNYTVDAHEECNKFDILVELYKKITICQAVIFVNTIEKACSLGKKLKNEGHAVGVIHGKLDDITRMDTLKRFRKTEIRVLIATDVIARGIDVQQVGLVINYDIPKGEGFKEQYIHRVGRSGRYEKIGVAINILTDDNNNSEWLRIHKISQSYKIIFDKLPKLADINYYLNGINGYSFKEMAGNN